jgi:hypothetical protein
MITLGVIVVLIAVRHPQGLPPDAGVGGVGGRPGEHDRMEPSLDGGGDHHRRRPPHEARARVLWPAIARLQEVQEPGVSDAIRRDEGNVREGLATSRSQVQETHRLHGNAPHGGRGGIQAVGRQQALGAEALQARRGRTAEAHPEQVVNVLGVGVQDSGEGGQRGVDHTASVLPGDATWDREPVIEGPSCFPKKFRPIEAYGILPPKKE